MNRISCSAVDKKAVPALVKYSHLTVGEIEVITHLYRQTTLTAAAEVHDAVLAATM